ncbi:hypothetical protein SDC9_144056 [bioreactor metagenome]|uniref:Uncharacterized protein n=1 Tax=bioreactor metagenome TaxID=1076179 RepID=A0A645E521_9ZZZZ
MRVFAKRSGRFTFCGVDAADLDRFKLTVSAFVEFKYRTGIENAFALAVAFPVVLFYIAYVRVFMELKAVYAVVLRGFIAAVMYAATSDDDDVSVLSNLKIVIHKLRKAGFGDDDGDMDAFVLGIGFYENINAGFVGLGRDDDIRA